MTKEEIINYLIENGASSDLIQKPAVQERILACFDADSKYGLITGNFDEILGPISDSLTVDEDGNITINDGVNTRTFKRMPNNEALYINNDESGFSVDEQGEYLIDKYGMDESFKDTDGHTIKRKEDGTIDADGITVADNGSPILNLYDLLNQKKDKSWSRNKQDVLKRYPRAEEWFKKREAQARQAGNSSELSDTQSKELQEEIDRLKSENNSLREKNRDLKMNYVPKKEFDATKTEVRRTKIERNILKTQIEEQRESNRTLTTRNQEQQSQNESLRAENEHQKQEIQSLKNRNQNLQRMLKQTLDFCESVRNSFLGRFFFGSKLKQLPPATQEQAEDNKRNNNTEQVR